MFGATLLLALTPALASTQTHHRKHRASPPSTPTTEQPVPDDLYRRRGYGQGGLVFGGGGQGGLARAGACADLAFAHPPNCGDHSGYGLYGNGIGYGFGF